MTDSKNITIGRAGNFNEAARHWGLANLHENIANRLWDKSDAAESRKEQFETGRLGDRVWDIAAEHYQKTVNQKTPAVKTGTFTTRHYTIGGSRN